MQSRRFLVFLGLFAILSLAIVVGSVGLVQVDVLRIRGHVTVGWVGLLPLVAYLLLSLRYILRTKG